MKKFLGILVLGLVLLVVQPANVLKADLASDILKKTQELAEKQKIKGKRLEEFILNNVIIVDYDGKKQSYKFNKDITYEVYEGKKVVGEGTWAIKGLTKSSIKLSGYMDIYFQIYKAKDRISTLTNLKKKNDDQTNRKILKIVSPNDFDEQLAQVELKEEKKKVTDKQETKKEEKVAEEKKQVAVEKKKEEGKKTEEEKKQLESSQDKTAEDVSVKKNIKHKTVDLRNENEFQLYTKDFMEDKIIGNFISIFPCKGTSTPHECSHLDPNIPASYNYTNFAVRKPYNLHWYMFNSGGTDRDSPDFMHPAIFTKGKNWAVYKDPRWKIKHNQKVCEPVYGEQLTKEDCVDGVSVLTFDVSFIKGPHVMGDYVGSIQKPYLNTGLGEITDEIFPSSDRQDKHWRKKLSFVFKKNNSFYKKVHTSSLFGNPWERTIAFMYPVVKVGDPLLKNFPGFEGHYLSYLNHPWGALMVSVGLDETLAAVGVIGEEKQRHIDTLLASIVFDVVENRKRTIPGTDTQGIAKKWEELSILGEDLKKCLNDNKTDFDKLESCSKSYQKSTRKIIDWKEEGWHNPKNKASIFNVAIVKLFPMKEEFEDDELNTQSEVIRTVQHESLDEIRPIKEGIRSFWEITACIDDEIKKVEYETDLDIISILEQNCFQLLDKNIAFNKEISQKLKEVKVIKKEKGWIGIQYEEVTQELAEDVGLQGKNSWGSFDKCSSPIHCGVIVKRVYEGSPAEKVGIQVDDIILQYNDKPMHGKGQYINLGSLKAFERQVDKTFAGQEVNLEIWRNKKKLTKKITLGKLEKSLDNNSR